MFSKPEAAENHYFQDFNDFHILGCLMTIPSPPDKWCLKLFNLNETLHVPRFHISSDSSEVLWEMNLGISRNSKKNSQISSKVGVWSAAVLPWRSITYSSKPLLCKLFEHCALAQRSKASKWCSEGQRASKIMRFMVFIILGPPEAKM